MTSSKTKVQKNQQDQTTMILNNQRIRGRHESKSRLWCAHLSTKVSHHHPLEFCPLSIFQESVLAPFFQEIFALSSWHLLFPQEWSNVSVQGALQPRCCIYKIQIWIQTLQLMTRYNWLILFVCLSSSICKMRILMCTHLTARRRKYLKYLALCQVGRNTYLMRIVKTFNN